MSRFYLHASLALTLATATCCGCRQVDLSSVPLADELGLIQVPAVPQEIVERYGPTAKDRLTKIGRQRAAAKKGSEKVREQISVELAEQIQMEPNPFLRQEIVRTLTECNTSTAGKILRAGLNDESVDVQIQCCRGWGKWGTEDSVQVLGEVLDNQLTDLDVKLAAIDGIQATQRLEGAASLVSLLDKREDPAIQYEALQALQRITGQKLAHDQEAWQAYVAEQIDKTSSEKEGATPSLVDRTLRWWR